jgi:hypothetical protein
MRRRGSAAWEDLGNRPDLAALNVQAQLDGRVRTVPKYAPEKVRARREEARQLFALMHAAVDAAK